MDDEVLHRLICCALLCSVEVGVSCERDAYLVQVSVSLHWLDTPKLTAAVVLHRGVVNVS